MSLINTLKKNDTLFSLEFSPPKKNMPVTTVYDAIGRLAPCCPAFVSITYGAGGGNRDKTIEVASHVQSLGLEAIAHLTCVGSDPSMIAGVLDELDKKGIKNILALRGDIPQGMDKDSAFVHYRHASDLISEIKKRAGFVVGAAAYPETHYESSSIEEDIRYLKLKAELGADFFITQLCFDANALVAFHERLYKADITVPVSVGIMPVLSPNQIIRMALLSACSIPAQLSRIISRYGEDAEAFRQAGIDYAVREIDVLRRNSIHRFHLYVMNKADETAQILRQSGLVQSR